MNLHTGKLSPSDESKQNLNVKNVILKDNLYFNSDNLANKVKNIQD